MRDMVTRANTDRAKEIARKALPQLVVLYAILVLFPIEYRATRLLLLLGGLAIWGGALFVWWANRRVRIPLLCVAALAILLLAMPGRRVSPTALRTDYLAALKLYRHTRYVWGGEGLLGIDCSGFVRKGLIWGQALNGLRTLNGAPIRRAVSLWWHDCSAKALRDGCRDLTVPLFEAGSINETDCGDLQPGDLAVTANGVHVMVYVGDRTWAEADPDLKRVVEVTVPTENRWFTVPVVLMRWRVLSDDRP